VAALELAGGVWGLVRVGALLRRNGFTVSSIVVAGVLGLVFVLFIAAGALLWRGGALGLWLSVAVQALQLPHIVTSPFGFLFGAPLSFAAGLNADAHLMTSALWHPGMGFSIDSEVPVAWIGLNLIALAALLLLFWLRRSPAPVPTRD
jgi:hypothetical protein